MPAGIAHAPPVDTLPFVRAIACPKRARAGGTARGWFRWNGNVPGAVARGEERRLRKKIEHSLSVGRRVDAQADLPPRAELFSFSPTLAEPPVGDRFFAGTEPAFPRNIRRFVG
jgi:hypothetical protein